MPNSAQDVGVPKVQAPVIPLPPVSVQEGALVVESGAAVPARALETAPTSVSTQEGATQPAQPQPAPRRSERIQSQLTTKSVSRLDIDEQLALALAEVILRRARHGVERPDDVLQTASTNAQNGKNQHMSTVREEFPTKQSADKHNVERISIVQISPTLESTDQQPVEKSEFWSDKSGMQLDQEMDLDQIEFSTNQPTSSSSKFEKLRYAISDDAYGKNRDISQVPYSSSMQQAHRVKILSILRQHAKSKAIPFSDLCEKVNKRRSIKKMIKSYRKWDNPTWHQASKRSDAKLWFEAKREEDGQMLEKGVFTEDNHQYSDIDKNKDTHVVGSMYVCQIKRNKKTGVIEKYKVRLVALGNQQKKGSYDDIKSSNARLESVKLMMALKVKTRARHFTIDVKGAYLNAKIPEDSKIKLYIRLPDGTIKKLLKLLYGLKQAGVEWQRLVTNDLLEAGFKQSDADPLIFSKWRKGGKAKNKGGDFLAFSLHTDDFYGISNSEEMEEEFFSYLKEKYGEVTIHRGKNLQYLGMVLEEREDGSMAVNMNAYYDKLVDMMPQLKGKKSRLPYSSSMNECEGDEEGVDNLQYLSYVGAVNFLSTRTRPNLLYGMSRLAQRCSQPTKGDMRRVEKMFKHINATMDQCIVFSPGGDLDLHAYVDASHNCYSDGKGHYGYAIFLGEGNAAFSVKSSKIKIVTQSSTETEYVGLNYVTREVVWARQLITDIGFPPKLPSTLFEDNASTILLATGHGRHEMTKHIAPRYHYVREQISNGSIRVEHKPTTEMVADVLTKPLDEELYNKFSRVLMNY